MMHHDRLRFPDLHRGWRSLDVRPVDRGGRDTAYSRNLEVKVRNYR